MLSSLFRTNKTTGSRYEREYISSHLVILPLVERHALRVDISGVLVKAVLARTEADDAGHFKHIVAGLQQVYYGCMYSASYGNKAPRIIPG